MHRPPRTVEDDASLYDLAPEPSPPATSQPRGTKIKPLAYRAPKDDVPAKSDTETIKNLYMPLWLLGGGVVINIVAAYLAQLFGTLGLQVSLHLALMRVAAQLFFGTAIMLAGVLIAVKFRGIELGPFWPAVLKLAAVSVAPSAVVAILSPGLAFVPFGFIIAWLIHFSLCFALLGVFFDLDESDTWYLVGVIFVIEVGVYFLLRSLL